MTLAPMDLDVHLPTPEERHERWRSAVRRRLVSLELRPTGESPQPGAFHERDLGDLLMTDWHSPGFEGVRGHRLAGEDDDALVLMTAQEGEMGVDLADRSSLLRPGSVMVLRSGVSGRVTAPGWLRKRSVRLPMSALTPFDVGGRVPDCLSIEASGSSLAWLLLDFLAGIDRQHAHLGSAEVEATRNALLSLIAGMIRASQQPAARVGDLLPVLRQQLETWIADHLADGAVRVRDLAAAYNVAPRTVHRAFAATGDTVGSVVRAHRLAAARKDLVQTTLSVATIAYRWGFCDASHLGREFRREMSMSPGDYRDAYGIA